MNTFRARRIAQNRRARAKRLLDRVPDFIILSTASRGLNLYNIDSCLCAAFVREELVLIHDTAYESVWARDQLDSSSVVPRRCSEMFGGSFTDWEWLFNGVAHTEIVPTIERAFVARVIEAVEADAVS